VIDLAIEGADRVAIEHGDLVLRADGRDLRFHRPVASQGEGATRREVAAAFRLRNDRHVAFDVGAYDPTQPLTIDPTVTFTTAFDGTGSSNGVFGIASAMSTRIRRRPGSCRS